MKLSATEFVPGANGLPRSDRLRDLHQAQNFAIELLCCGLKRSRHSHVNVVQPGDTYAHSLKCGFSMMPKTFPNGSFTVATLMFSPTSCTASFNVAPRSSK